MSAAPAPAGRTRRAFLGGAAAGAAVLVAARPPGAAAAGSPEGDLAILSLALDLEHLQAALHTQAARRRVLGPAGTRVAEAIGGVERAHVALLTEALGSAAAPPPLFDLAKATGDDGTFIRTAVALEELAAATLLHQIPRVHSPRHRALLASVHTVDAGHASWIRLQAGVPPVPAALDDPLPPAAAVAMLVRGGYARARPGTPAGSPWAIGPAPGPDLLDAFPLARPAPAAPTAPAVPEATEEVADALPWRPWAATTGALSALVLGGLGLRARHARARVIVVGPDEGPRVSQRAGRTPRSAGVADDPGAADGRSRRPRGPGGT